MRRKRQRKMRKNTDEDEEGKKTEEEDGTNKQEEAEEKMTKGEDDEYKPWFRRRWTLEGIDRVLTHPLSLPLIEKLASCASYLPFAVRMLDNCATTSYGKTFEISTRTHMRRG